MCDEAGEMRGVQIERQQQQFATVCDNGPKTLEILARELMFNFETV